jgi:prevent-host-death family protein
MKTATVSYTKNKLSALLALVRHGETILITDRNRPVARLEPAIGTEIEYEQGRLQRLERQGVVRVSPHPLTKDFLSTKLPRPAGNGDILKALLAERGEGR